MKTNSGSASSNQASPSDMELEVTLTFDGDMIEMPWTFSEFSPVTCAICGKGCNGKDKPWCVNGNPFCG